MIQVLYPTMPEAAPLPSYSTLPAHHLAAVPLLAYLCATRTDYAGTVAARQESVEGFGAARIRLLELRGSLLGLHPDSLLVRCTSGNGSSHHAFGEQAAHLEAPVATLDRLDQSLV